MVKRFFVLFTVCSYIFSLHSLSQNILPQRPKLVVGIVIDNFRYDYFLRFYDKFENNGFKRLVNEGSVFRDAHLNYMFTQTLPGLATIVSGAQPSGHGIVADEWYDRLTNKSIKATRKENFPCVACDNKIETHSPTNLIASTIGDELKMFTFKQAKVISVSLDPASAVILAGHLADGAYWYDIFSGKFVTTSYYLSEIPNWTKEFNNKKLADVYIEQAWTLLYPDSVYNSLVLPDNSRYEQGIKGKKTFPYDLKLLSERTDGRRDYQILKYTPYGNNLVKDFAIAAIVNENLGKDNFSDILFINFNAIDYIARQYSVLSFEYFDALLRLDKDIAHLLNFLDNYIGKQNLVVFVTSNHGSAYPSKMLEELNMQTGTFNQSQAFVLLKSYLNALYGEGDWVKMWSGQQIFLNHQLIQSSKLNIENVQDEITRFLVQFQGITHVATASMLQKTSFHNNGQFERMQNSYYQERSGDIMYCLAPGWTELTESLAPHNSSYNYDTHVPLIYYGWKIPRQVVYSKTDLSSIAPTLSAILNISVPNASTGSVSYELFNK